MLEIYGHISILRSEVHELLLCDSPLNLTDFIYGAFPLHGAVRCGSLLGGFPLGTVFLVPPRPRFQANRTITKT